MKLYVSQFSLFENTCSFCTPIHDINVSKFLMLNSNNSIFLTALQNPRTPPKGYKTAPLELCSPTIFLGYKTAPQHKSLYIKGNKTRRLLPLCGTKRLLPQHNSYLYHEGNKTTVLFPS
jgi:hypothetical protein